MKRLHRSQIRSLIREAAGAPEEIRIGETYTDPDGNRVTVTDIYALVMFHTDVYVEYDYETTDGHTGHEKNSIERFVNIISGKR